MIPTPLSSRRLAVFWVLNLFVWRCGAYEPLPRWGQATVLLNDKLYVYGGKTDQFNSYSYTAALTCNDLLLLDLSSSFDLNSPPWQYVSGSLNSSTNSGPTLAWHTLSAFNESYMLMFGGDGGPNSPIVQPNLADSAILVDLSSELQPQWISESTSWAGEPSRRIRHSTSSTLGKVWIVGGEKDDGSGLAYSDHYVFDPTVPSFTQLPSGGPPDLLGHSSVVLSNGTLLVLGGYSPSESRLIPFTSMWTMDTTQSQLAWSNITLQVSSVPQGRRDFAATILSGDKVLIHGGGDALLQTSYSDGWILDMTSMSWTNITALATLGPRRDHFAVQMGSEVLFAFGYALNGGASAALQLFDVDSGSFSSTFQPQPSAIQTTLPVPSGTGTPSSGSGPSGSNDGSVPTGSNSGSGSAGTSVPTSSGGSSSGGSGDSHGQSPDDGSKKGVIGVALGVALGFMFAAAGVVLVIIITRRRRHGGWNERGRFRLIGSDDTEAPHGEKVVMVGTNDVTDQGTWRGWTILGRTRNQQGATFNRQRIDMLAEEDERSFGVRSVRRDASGSSSSWYSSFGQERRLTNMFNVSLNSLRSVGNLITSTMSRTGSGGRYVGGLAVAGIKAPEWEKNLPPDPFSDDAALLRDDNPEITSPIPLDDILELRAVPASRPRGGQLDSLRNVPYSDPFSDDEPTESYADFGASKQDIGESTMFVAPTLAPRTSILTNSTRSSMLSLPPLVTVSTQGSGTDPSSSQSSHTPSSQVSSTGLSSGTSHNTNTLSSGSFNRPHSTSIIGAIGAPSAPLKRSESWWTRFKRTSLRDTVSGSLRSPVREPLEFRDPNPAPRLVAIQESAHSNSPNTPESARQRNQSMYSIKGGHERSMSSLQTAQTADSAALERMGGKMDVVQRVRSFSSHTTTPSTTESPEISTSAWNHLSRPVSDVLSSDQSLYTQREMVEDPESGDVNPFESDQDSSRHGESSIPSDKSARSSATHPNARIGDPSAMTVRRPLAIRRPTAGNNVAARVAEYERRMSQDISTPISPTTTAITAHERPPAAATEAQKRHRTSKPVHVYDLVQRPELFVANPDRRMEGSGDS